MFEIFTRTSKLSWPPSKDTWPLPSKPVPLLGQFPEEQNRWFSMCMRPGSCFDTRKWLHNKAFHSHMSHILAKVHVLLEHLLCPPHPPFTPSDCTFPPNTAGNVKIGGLMEVNKLPQETSNTFAYLQWIGNVHWEFLDTKIQSPSEPYGASDKLLDSTSLFCQFIPGILFQQIWK